VLQGIGSEDTDDAITASAVETAFLGRAAKRARHFNVHPLEELALFVEDVNVAVGCKHENTWPLYCNPDEYLQLYFGKVDGVRLNNWR